MLLVNVVDGEGFKESDLYLESKYVRTLRATVTKQREKHFDQKNEKVKGRQAYVSSDK